MGIDRLERVMWRLRIICPDRDKPLWTELRRAIDLECGTDPQTYTRNRAALIRLGWIRSYNSKRARITNKDIVG